jgi:hypothetical protein
MAELAHHYEPMCPTKRNPITPHVTQLPPPNPITPHVTRLPPPNPVYPGYPQVPPGQAPAQG